MQNYSSENFDFSIYMISNIMFTMQLRICQTKNKNVGISFTIWGLRYKVYFLRGYIFRNLSSFTALHAQMFEKEQKQKLAFYSSVGLLSLRLFDLVSFKLKTFWFRFQAENILLTKVLH